MAIDNKEEFKKKIKHITIRLNVDDYNKLVHMSRRNEIPISQLIRTAIKEFFKLDMIHIN